MKRICLSEIARTRGIAESLQEVQRAVRSCQRCIIITGAGISQSSGIPDFRSPDGLFQQLKQKYPQVSSGQYLFDANLFRDPGMVGLFYNFMGEFRNLVSQANCTPTHAFIKELDECGKLLRCYTQNIDSLEKRAGLETSFLKPHADSSGSSSSSSSESKHLGDDAVCGELCGDKSEDDSARSNGCLTPAPKPDVSSISSSSSSISSSSIGSSLGVESAATTAATNQADSAASASTSLKPALKRSNSARRQRPKRQTTLDKTFTKAVQLHGDLENVICTICHTKYPFTEKLAEEFCEGAPPPCPRCKEIEAIRDLVGKRSVATGFLRPDIVLYNETHPQGELIGTLSEFDLKRRPDLLIVIGTSLKIPGVKRMVREMSRCVHACPTKAKRAGAGKSIFINRDEPPKGWEGVFDYYIAGDSDQAIGLLPIKDADTKTDDNISQTTGAECVEQPEVRIVQNPAKSVMSIASICNPTDTKPKVQPEFEAARAALEDAVSGSDPAGECTSATAASALAGSPAAAAKTRSRAKKEPRPLASLLEPSRRVGLSRSSIKQPKTRKLTATMKVVKNATSSSSKAANAAAAAAATTAAGKRAKKTHSISSS